MARCTCYAGLWLAAGIRCAVGTGAGSCRGGIDVARARPAHATYSMGVLGCGSRGCSSGTALHSGARQAEPGVGAPLPDPGGCAGPSGPVEGGVRAVGSIMAGKSCPWLSSLHDSDERTGCSTAALVT